MALLECHGAELWPVGELSDDDDGAGAGAGASSADLSG